jgi:hypothetical protein
LDIGPEAQQAHEMRVEARAEAAGAGGGGDEVHVLGRPPRLGDGLARGLRGQLESPAAEAIVQLIDAFLGRLVLAEDGGIEIEIPALDLAIGEEAGALRVGVARHAQDGGLIEAVGRCGRSDGDDLGGAHAGLVMATRLR